MEGHRVRYCPALARKCPVYEDLGLSASHRMGSLACKPSARKKKTRQKEGIAPRVAEKKEMTPSTGPTEVRRDGEKGRRGDGAFSD
jgi:hypothetical protein